MGFASIKIAGADDYATNQSGNNWANAAQMVSAPAKVFSLTAANRSGATRYVVLFDTAAGTTAQVAPKTWLTVFDGLTSTLEFGSGGSPFESGVYALVTSVAPADANTSLAASLGSANDVLATIEYRLR